jgi:YD repeat-containing protein
MDAVMQALIKALDENDCNDVIEALAYTFFIDKKGTLSKDAVDKFKTTTGARVYAVGRNGLGLLICRMDYKGRTIFFG